ncbi:MAG TPA: response regulator [Bryobacteraceae bacterium]|nr:response regulator [Bryobacteraceae bacterium]
MTGEQPKYVLVVDDEPDVRAYLRSALEDAGFLVRTACDGQEALELIRHGPPDLISLDLVMPRHSGVMLHRELQKDKQLSKIPVLVVTGHARDDLGRTDFEEMTMSGPGIYLEKPVRPGSYVSAVCKLLGIDEAKTAPPEGEEDLRQSLDRALSGANRDALQRALDALRKK